MEIIMENVATHEPTYVHDQTPSVVLALDSDVYQPTTLDDGTYADYVPPSSHFKNGFRCPCGARKEHVFYNRSSFAVHIKSKTHQKWLTELTAQKTNYFTEETLKELVHSQKILLSQKEREIAQLKHDLMVKSKTIDLLTIQLTTTTFAPSVPNYTNAYTTTPSANKLVAENEPRWEDDSQREPLTNDWVTSAHWLND